MPTDTSREDILAGWSLLDDGDLDGASAAAETALEVDPENVLALELKGTVALNRGEARYALPIFEKAAAILPNLAAPRIGLGLSWAQLGERVPAEKHFREALRIGPDHPLTRMYLGEVLAAQRKFEEAEIQFRVAADMAPDFAPAQNAMALMLADLGRAPEAWRYSLKARDLAQGDAESWAVAGDIALNDNDLALAQDFLQKAKALGAKNPRTEILEAMLKRQRNPLRRAGRRLSRWLMRMDLWGRGGLAFFVYVGFRIAFAIYKSSGLDFPPLQAFLAVGYVPIIVWIFAAPFLVARVIAWERPRVFFGQGVAEPKSYAERW